MRCPYCKDVEMLESKHDYHHLQITILAQPKTTILSVLYKCPCCGTTVETSQQVRIVSPKEG